MSASAPSSEVATHRTTSGSSSLQILLVVAALLCAALFVGELYLFSGELGFPLDDSWIHL